MDSNYLVFLAGITVLYFGADWLVRGASSLAMHLGVRPLVIGLTVVALGTSMPEFILNLLASIKGEDSIAVGNIVGSNIANIALILGLASVIFPTIVDPGTVRREYPMVLGASLLFWTLAAAGGEISRLDGVILLVGLALFLVWLIRDAREHARRSRGSASGAGTGSARSGGAGGGLGQVPDSPGTRDPAAPGHSASLDAAEPAEGGHGPVTDGRHGAMVRLRLATTNRFLLIAAGCAALAWGANLMVDSATAIADGLGVEHVVIGLTIVAVGTSLPELAASVLCALRRQADLSIGNIFGSNLLNVLFVVGFVAVIHPIQVEPVAVEIHFPVMIAFTALLFPLAWTRFRISRVEGGALLAGFLAYFVYLAYPYL